MYNQGSVATFSYGRTGRAERCHRQTNTVMLMPGRTLDILGCSAVRKSMAPPARGSSSAFLELPEIFVPPSKTADGNIRLM